MRIVAGELKGRQFVAPSGHRTHPMSERVRGAIFNALGDIGGLSVLDAYGGSGALAFEALSRGASCADIIDIDKHAATIIADNAAALGLADVTKVIRANAGGWSALNPDNLYDLVFCDPPYDAALPEAIAALSHHVTGQGLLILSWPGARGLPELPGLARVLDKSFGDAQLGFYRREPSTGPTAASQEERQ